MCGWDGDDDGKADIHTRDVAESPRLADTLLALCGTYGLDLAPVVYNPGSGSSDQLAFWNEGFSAIVFGEAYWGGDFNPYYHTSDDRIQYFNLNFFHECAKLGVGALAVLAGIEEPLAVPWADVTPSVVRLEQNYPNPFNANTLITYSLAGSESVSLEVFDMLGRSVTTLVDGLRPGPGSHTIELDFAGQATGVYVYRLRAGNAVIARRMMYIR